MAAVLTADLAESTTQVRYAGPPTAGLEKVLAGVLAEVVDAERVPVGSNFFDDLGADSMVMARFCARVRKRPDLPPVSMKDIYQHPTISSLAASLTDDRACPVPGSPAPTEVAAPVEVAAPASTLQYVFCGALQFLFFLGSCLRCRGCRRLRLRVDLRRRRFDRHLSAVGPVRRRGLPRPVRPADPGEVGAHRPVEAPADPHLEPGVCPLLDRQDAGPVEPSGPAVRRFAALRALSEGAGRENRARRRDLLPARARLHRPAHHRRRHGHPQRFVLPLLPGARGPDPDRCGHPRPGRFHRREDHARHRTSMGDGAQIGHACSLHAGQAVPGGERWHGSPAQRTEVDYRVAGPARCGTLRRAVYTVLQLLKLLFVYLPLASRRREHTADLGPEAQCGPGPGRVAFTARRSTSTP